MRQRRFVLIPLLWVILFSSSPLTQAQQQSSLAKAPSDPIERIKDEGMNHSQIMQTLSYLSDVMGPRLTGSPSMKRANEWTRDLMSKWGLQNAHLEAWGPFGRGWVLKDFFAEVVAPQTIPLIAYPKAWSPGTNGVLTADVVWFDAKDTVEMEKFRGRLGGKIVLTDPLYDVKPLFEPMADRYTDADLLVLANAPAPDTGQSRPFGPDDPQFPAFAKRRLFFLQRLQFFQQEGAALLVSSSGDGGTIYAQSASVPQAFDPSDLRSLLRPAVNAFDQSAPRMNPQIVLSNEQYNRILRILQAGEPVKMSVKIAVQAYDQDLMAYNTIAEIPGTDKKDEVVMLGGHLDSWHSGTGATDNGAGVCVAMEAVRILKALNLEPRRTIRVALWSGEEEGLLGSRAYVKEHFGERDVPNSGTGAAKDGVAVPPGIHTKPEYDKLDVYFNLDAGAGKIRGVYLQGNEAVRSTFRDWLTPLRAMGVATLSIKSTSATDHIPFDEIGLPGFQFIQDPIEYWTRSHHSNQDVFDRVQTEEIKQAATVMAVFIYNAAMQDEKLSRKAGVRKGD